MPRIDDEPEAPADDRPMTLAEHLDELRKRVALCVGIAAAFIGACACVEEALLGIALAPANAVLEEMNGSAAIGPLRNHFVSNAIGEKFFIAIKVDVVVGLFLAAPLILYVLWGFVARGLHPHERRYVHAFAPFSYVLFMGGCAFFYFVLQPITLRFLLGYHASDVIGPDGRIIVIPAMPTIEGTVSFFLSMALVTGLFFELPLLMLFLQMLRICSWKTYVAYARHFVLALVVLSAVITPTGDMFTLLVFMIPVLILFVGGIGLCRIMAPNDL